MLLKKIIQTFLGLHERLNYTSDMDNLGKRDHNENFND